MFVVCTNVNGNQSLASTAEWTKLRVEIPVNTYMRCQLKLKQISMYSEFTLPHPNVLANIVELKWSESNEVVRFMGTFEDAYLPIRVLHLRCVQQMDVWLGEVYTQAKYVDVEYRLSSSSNAGVVQHPDMLQFVFEVDL